MSRFKPRYQPKITPLRSQLEEAFQHKTQANAKGTPWRCGCSDCRVWRDKPEGVFLAALRAEREDAKPKVSAPSATTSPGLHPLFSEEKEKEAEEAQQVLKDVLQEERDIARLRQRNRHKRDDSPLSGLGRGGRGQ